MCSRFYILSWKVRLKKITSRFIDYHIRLRKLYAGEIRSRFAGFYALLFDRFYLKITGNYVVSSSTSLLHSYLMQRENMQNRLTGYFSLTRLEKWKINLTKIFFLALIYLFYNILFFTLFEFFIVLKWYKLCCKLYWLPFTEKKRRNGDTIAARYRNIEFFFLNNKKYKQYKQNLIIIIYESIQM